MGSDGRTFICGEKYTLADVGMTSILVRIEAANFDLLFADLANISKYWKRIKERPSYSAAISRKELPIMRVAFARVKLWKEAHPWFRDALETSKPIGASARAGFLLRLVGWAFSV